MWTPALAVITVVALGACRNHFDFGFPPGAGGGPVVPTGSGGQTGTGATPGIADGGAAAGGQNVETPTWAAAPFLFQLKSDWRRAALAWENLGCVYEQALALAEGDGEAQIDSAGGAADTTRALTGRRMAAPRSVRRCMVTP